MKTRVNPILFHHKATFSGISSLVVTQLSNFPLHIRPLSEGTKRYPFLLLYLLIGLTFAACNMVDDPKITPEIDPETEIATDFQTIKVTLNGQPAPESMILWFESTEAAPDTLFTNSSGEAVVDLQNRELPTAVFAMVSGHDLGYKRGESATTSLLSFNLKPTDDRQILVLLNASHASAAVSADLWVDEYFLGNFYSGTATRIVFPFSLPNGVSNKLDFETPPGIGQVSLEPSTSMVPLNNSNYILHRVLPYLTNESLPQGITISRGGSEEIALKHDGFAWASNANAAEISLNVPGLPSQSFALEPENFWLSPFIPVIPVLHPEVEYQPLFTIEHGQEWKFEGEIRSTSQTITTTTNYTLVWNFREIQTTPAGLRYFITETVNGERSSYFEPITPINVETEIIIDENQSGIWTYSNSSMYSPTLHNNGWMATSPTHSLDWERVEVLKSDGSTYRTAYGKPGRLVPVNVTSYTFGNQFFKADEHGIVTTFEQSPSSNQSRTKRLTRITD